MLCEVALVFCFRDDAFLEQVGEGGERVCVLCEVVFCSPPSLLYLHRRPSGLPGGAVFPPHWPALPLS
jgi:hypothetical protein